MNILLLNRGGSRNFGKGTPAPCERRRSGKMKLRVPNKRFSGIWDQNPRFYSYLKKKYLKSWNSTGRIGRIGRHLAEKSDVEMTMCLSPMPPDASDFPGGIPA